MHGCTVCCATPPASAKGVDAAYVTISIRLIIIQHLVFVLDTLYVGLFWHGYCDDIGLWALFQKGGDIHAGTFLPAVQSPEQPILPKH